MAEFSDVSRVVRFERNFDHAIFCCCRS
jgi:hypothetical protein